MTAPEKSADQIEREVSEQRAEVDRSTEELKRRASPEALFDYGREYMRGDGGKRLLSAVERNPLAALMTLAGVGWLLYTASQPEEERWPDEDPRVRAARRPAPPPAPIGDAPAAPPARPETLATGSAVPAGSPSAAAPASEPRPDAARPGVLGDQTQEQNLNQPGHPERAETKEDVEAAFRKDPDARSEG